MLARSRVWIGAGEDAELRRRHGQRAAAAQRVVEENPGAAEQRGVHLVQRLDAGDLVDHPQLQMVLQVLADARLVEHHRNAELLRAARPGPTPDSSSVWIEPIEPADRITSPRQRATFTAPFCRKRTPTARLPSNSTRSTRQPVSSRRFCRVERGLEKAARRRPAPAELLVDVIGRRAFVVAGVEIVDALDAGLLGRGAERVEQVPAHARMLDPPFAAGGVMLACAEEMVLVLLEHRQHVVPAPAGEAELAPVVVVGGLAAHVDHGVDRRRAADHLAARIVQRAAVEAGHRFGLEHPVRARIADGEQIADRDVEPDPVVAAAGFEHQHAVVRIGRQPIRQHAAGRARADDDVVVFAFERCVATSAMTVLLMHVSLAARRQRVTIA